MPTQTISFFHDGICIFLKCEVAPIKHAPEECNGRSKDYMKFRGKLGKKDETEVSFKCRFFACRFFDMKLIYTVYSIKYKGNHRTVTIIYSIRRI